MIHLLRGAQQPGEALFMLVRAIGGGFGGQPVGQQVPPVLLTQKEVLLFFFFVFFYKRLSPRMMARLKTHSARRILILHAHYDR